MSQTSDLPLEALAIGALITVVGFLVDYGLNILIERVPRVGNMLNGNTRKAVALFAIGVISHFVAEMGNLNKWHCEDVTDGNHPVISMAPAQLWFESLVIGGLVTIVGMTVEYVSDIFFLDEYKEPRYNISDRIKRVIILYVTGFVTHIIAESSAINKWHCSNVTVY
jgi:hypothetical protein